MPVSHSDSGPTETRGEPPGGDTACLGEATMCSEPWESNGYTEANPDPTCVLSKTK